MIALHIHDIIRYSQKKMTEKYISYIYFRTYMWESVLFLHFQSPKKKRKKFDAAQFLDARGDEKQVINLELPNVIN